MSRQTFNLVFGIGLLVILVASLVPTLTSGAMPGTRQLIFSGALLLFAISRLIMFKSPESGIINPMRTIALIAVVASFLVKG